MAKNGGLASTIRGCAYLALAAGLGIAYVARHRETVEIPPVISAPVQEERPNVPVEYRPLTTEPQAETQRTLDRTYLENMIRRHEGVRYVSYTDTTGNRTVGVGFNLERDDARQLIESLRLSYEGVRQGTVSLTEGQVNTLLQGDISQAITDAQRYLGGAEVFNQQPVNVQNVVVDMAFNLGYGRLSQFRNFRDAIVGVDYARAAQEMENSRWYHQTGNRARELVEIMHSEARD